VIINDTVTNLLACVGLSVILVILVQLLATILNLLWFVGDTRFNKKQKLKAKQKIPKYRN
jgi:sorbitol-specific phosphotransferase system component IIC